MANDEINEKNVHIRLEQLTDKLKGSEERGKDAQGIETEVKQMMAYLTGAGKKFTQLTNNADEITDFIQAVIKKRENFQFNKDDISSYNTLMHVSDTLNAQKNQLKGLGL